MNVDGVRRIATGLEIHHRENGIRLKTHNLIQKIDFELYKTGIKNNFDESKKYILSENYLYENYKFLIQ